MPEKCLNLVLIKYLCYIFTTLLALHLVCPSISESSGTIGGITGGTTYVQLKTTNSHKVKNQKISIGVDRKKKHIVSEEKVYTELIEDTMDNLRRGSLVFTVEEKMNISESTTPLLAISVTKSVQELLEEYKIKFTNNTGSINLVNFVEAELNGLDFDIKELSKKQQTVNSRKDISWEWEVRPKKNGQLKLTLTVNSLLSIGGKDKFMNITSMHKDVYVDVDYTEKVVEKVGKIGKSIQDAYPLLIVGAIFIYFILPVNLKTKLLGWKDKFREIVKW